MGAGGEEAVVLTTEVSTRTVTWQWVRALTIVSLCRIADANRLSADGVASSARIMFAPLLWPASVIFELPPKEVTTLWTNFIAFITSCTARLVPPSGAIKPRAPRRYWTTATIEPVAMASLDPSRPSLLAEPT